MTDDQAINEQLLEEGADWIAEMLSTEMGGFIPAELCDLVIQAEAQIRVDLNDPLMDHQTMAAHVMKELEKDPYIPTGEGKVSEFIIAEILHWEDEFRAMAGHPRYVRR